MWKYVCVSRRNLWDLQVTSFVFGIPKNCQDTKIVLCWEITQKSQNFSTPKTFQFDVYLHLPISTLNKWLILDRNINFSSSFASLFFFWDKPQRFVDLEAYRIVGLEFHIQKKITKSSQFLSDLAICCRWLFSFWFVLLMKRLGSWSKLLSYGLL